MAVKYTKVNEMKLVAFSTKVLEKLGMPHDDAFNASAADGEHRPARIASHAWPILTAYMSNG